MITKKDSFILKEFIDLALSYTLIVILVPFFVIFAILIKRDSGPVFFFQDRLGQNASVFKIIKFRTMIVNADNYLDEKGEPTINRITPIGRFLRKTSLDELPQLVNILRSEMSIVGPRPTLPEHYQFYEENHKKRFQMKPGVTGLAQISGRNNLKWSERLALDVEYVETFNIWLDIKILLGTLSAILTSSGVVMDRNASQVFDLSKSKILRK